MNQSFNERIKLAANFLNSSAVGVFLAWVVVPGAALLYGGGQTGNRAALLVGVPIGLAGAMMLHLAASIVLTRLRE